MKKSSASPHSRSIIWWLRRDIRLADNLALTRAAQLADVVWPVFVLDPYLLTSSYCAGVRQNFLMGALRSLDADLRRRGSRLIVRHGEPAQVLQALLYELNADQIVAEADYSTYARRRDKSIAGHLSLELVNGPAIHAPGTIMKANGEPYTIFTPFSRAWQAYPSPQAHELTAAPECLPVPYDVPSEDLSFDMPTRSAVLFPPSEAEAQRRLNAFVQHDIHAYDRQRNELDQQGTSQLSPYLRFGLLSARQAAVTAINSHVTQQSTPDSAGPSAWLNELIWRDFYIHILYHFPQVATSSFRQDLRHVAWQNHPGDFDAWCTGRTGYPVVDAAMRQLSTTGWMHNRARMIVASFLVKDLLIDWRWGEKWFMQQLIDGDPAANNGAWQWSAGTGTDAAPYFRVFNPTTQGKKFDPRGDYVRQWVPELAKIEGSAIHEPWRLRPLELKAAGLVLGRDYPLSIIDHQFARARALAAIAAAREKTV